MGIYMNNIRFIKSKLLLFSLSSLLILFLFGCTAKTVATHPYKVRVMLELPEGIACTSQNPVYVEAGSPVFFDVAVGEDYAIEKLSHGALYADGKISLDGIWLSATIKPVLKKSVFYSVTALSSEGGSVSGINQKAAQGSVVTLSAEEDENHIFTGWTTGALAGEGGKAYSDENTIEISADKDTVMYANFAPSHTVKLVCGEGISSDNSLQKILRGSSASFKVTFDEGWIFDSYIFTYKDETGAEHSVSDSPRVTVGSDFAAVNDVSGDCTITLSAKDSYIRNIEIKARNGTGSLDGKSVFRFGNEVSIIALPDTGYVFTGWSEGNYISNGGHVLSKEAYYKFNVTDDMVLYANFAKVHTVTLKTDGNFVSDNYTVTIVQGESASFRLTFNTGYMYGSNDRGGYYSNGVFTINNINESFTVNITSIRATECTVTVHSSAGGVVTGAGKYLYGDSISLRASFNSGYEFIGWSSGYYLSSGGTLVSADSVYAFTVKENLTLYANFIKLHTVTVSYGSNISGESSTYTVRDGQELRIKLTVAAGYTYDGNNMGGVYSDGYLVFPAVNSSFNVNVQARMLKLFYITVRTNNGAGKTSRTGFSAHELSKTDLIATPSPGYQFLCWTEGATLENYGTVVNKNAAFFYEASSDITLYANFGEADRAYMLYHANGGKVANSDRDVLYSTFSLAVYIYPNAIADLGTFTRDGHTLLEYAETPDGKGVAVNPGGKLINYNGGLLELWAVWSQWTPAKDFTYVKSGSSARITGYNGNASVLSIPAAIDGNRVVTISANAVKNKSFKTLVLPNTIVNVEPQAFVGCMGCEKIYLCDSLQIITNESFKDCKSFNTFCFNAATPPAFISQNRGYAQFRRFERLVKYIGKEDCIVIISGSSSLHGIDSKLMMDKIAGAGYDYTVINFGTNMSNNSQFFMRLVYTFADKGDIVVVAPEFGGNQLGDRPFSDQFFVGFECAYNMFRHVDMSTFTNIFGSFNSFLATKRSANRSLSYEDYYPYYDEYVTYTEYRATRPDDNYNATRVTMNYTAGTLTNTRINNLNEVFGLLQSKGIKVYMSFAPMNKNAYIGTLSNANAFENVVDTKLLCTRISNIWDYIFLPRYFHDSNYHLGTEGCAMRSEKLAGDIIARLNKEAGK